MVRRELPLFSSRKSEPTFEKSGNYATEADFCRLFSERLTRFYTLSLLLLGDRERAEECFLRSFNACLKSRGVFKDWEERWAIHTIIKEAINMMSLPNLPSVESLSEQDSDVEVLVSALRELTSLDRCVYLMSVLEKYSDRECASFLSCSAAEVRIARDRALKMLGRNALLYEPEAPMPLRMIS
jgi:DNA-directed RNA polymerase specialized sigma24 family protein